MDSVLSRLVADRFELRDLVGYGGMGDVWAAYDKRLDRMVAVKLLRLSMSKDPSVRKRFQVEARSAGTVAHPHVVQVYDTGEHEGLPYIVMELLPGSTLSDRFREGRMPDDEILLLAKQVLSGLDAAHSCGVVHRDVKPGNIMRSSDGSWKVGDFGIAKSEEDSAALTQTGTLMGTLSYLAPERLHGKEATSASDLYALGVVLYEACAGSRPFDASTPGSLVVQMRDDVRAPLPVLCPDLPRELLAVVEGFLIPDPLERMDASTALRVLEGSVPPPLTEQLAIREQGDVPTGAVEAPLVLDEEEEALALPSQRLRSRFPLLLLPLLGILAVALLLFLPSGDPGSAAPVVPPAPLPVPGEVGSLLDELEAGIAQ